MFRFTVRKRSLPRLGRCLLTTAICGLLIFTAEAAAQDLSGRELLSVTRVAHGGAEYGNLRYVTATSEGFISLAPFGVTTPLTGTTLGQLQVNFSTRDYQDRSLRRRLEATPSGGALTLLGGGVSAAGSASVGGAPIYLVYTGQEGRGVFLGTPFRIGDVTVSRQWAMMGFNTLNLAVENAATASRQRDEVFNGLGHYVVEVRLNSDDSVRYWINKTTFLISKVVARTSGRPNVEEERGDYQKVPGSCLLLPFHIVTRVNGQQVADMRVKQYDIATEISPTLFTVTTIQ